jgi:2-polyprenyl-3-methyl-5-hydroxy-6-metoxy-1,4-benzoquinol methylase
MADSSPGMLAVLGAKIKAAQAAHMVPLALDLMRDEPPAERFDLIYTLLTLHHVADVDRLLAVFFTMLKPGCHLAAADLDAEDGSFHDPGFNGHNGFAREALGRQAERAGFAQVRFQTVHEIVKTRPDGRSRAFPVFLLTAERARSL